MRKTVAVIGAGYAGLSVSIHLDPLKFELFIYETKPYIGGRASSYHDKQFNCELDNGQHMLMSCYKETLQLYKILGIETEIYKQKQMQIPYKSVSNLNYSFNAQPFLPAPLHVLKTLLFSKTGLSLAERLNLIRFSTILSLKNIKPQTSVSELFQEYNLSKNTINRIWRPIVLAVFNEDPDYIRATEFQTVVKILFLKKNNNSIPIIIRKGLSEFLNDSVTNYVRIHKHHLYLNQRVQDITKSATGNFQLKINNIVKQFDIIISSIPAFSLQHIFNNSNINFESFKTRSIITIYFIYPETLFESEFIGLIDSTIEWIFKKNDISDLQNDLYSVVISNANKYNDPDKLKEIVLNELKQLFQLFDVNKMTQFKIIHEKRATFISQSRYEKIDRHFTPNLFLCGDWTYNQLPSTIESAVLSGKLTADNINRSFDHNE